MAPRRRCPTCGSRQWHKEPSSGLIACSEGHVLQNYRNEATEAETMDLHTLRKRTLKSGREKKEAKSKANAQLYHGTRGRYHYFQCLQILLRKQVTTLTSLWELPKEFEVVCRDIWTLHLELLPSPPTVESYSNAQADRNEKGTDIILDYRTAEKTEGNEENIDREEHPESGESNEGDNDETTEDEDPELAALLRANSDLDSSADDTEASGDKEENDPAESGDKRKKGRTRGLYFYETPVSTLAVLMVACWTMRIPALSRDIIKLIEAYELPYLDPIARQLLPESMVIHLTKHNTQALSPHHAPSAQALHGMASRLSRMMYSSYKIFTPEANAAPILWRVVSQGLASTPILYRLTKRLGSILSLPLTLHDTLAPGLKKRKTYDSERHKHDNVAPEVGFIAVAIIVLKMIYGLDRRTRSPKDPENVACGFPRLDEYLLRLRLVEDKEAKKRDEMIFDSRSDVCMGDVSEEMIDEYLRFCSRALIGGGDGDTVLERYFPLREEKNGHQDRKEDETFERLGAMPVNEDGLPPGEGYRIYRGRDVEGKKTEEYELVLRRAAQWTGVGVDHLGGVVETYERRLARSAPLMVNRKKVTW